MPLFNQILKGKKKKLTDHALFFPTCNMYLMSNNLTLVEPTEDCKDEFWPKCLPAKDKLDTSLLLLL